MIFGGGAQQGYAANVDLLNGCGQSHIGPGHRLLEGVEIDHHQIDGGQVVRGQFIQVFAGASSQNAAVHGRVQRLNATVQDFREAG